MNMEKFKTGDLVRHITGAGGKMAVEGYDQQGNVICKWRDHKKGKWEQESFPEETLKLVEKEKPLKAEPFKLD